MQLSQKQNIFSQFILPYGNLDSVLNILKKKMTLLADVFLNLRTPKNVVRWLTKKSRLRARFNK